MEQPAMVLLSGGMDSAVALLWARNQERYDHVDAIYFSYGQLAQEAEFGASMGIFALDRAEAKGVRMHKVVALPPDMFAGTASILGRSEVDEYETVEEAVENTPNDRSYIPLRNAIFVTLAAHHLLARYPQGGDIVIGIRGRNDPTAPPGFPDCTTDFANKMAYALSQAAGVPVNVIDPLNRREHPSREDTIRFAMEMNGRDYLARSVTCFTGTRCGKCLPCQRRRQAFEAVGIADPAILK